ncbi:di-heme-cytochrome C peroxidase [Niveispirillum sp.]|uniref:di-heme-cytochrome C peroxidase n=1 Tax=Niveispirillum sp. TaxID=1917217 RepID=UPI001B51ABF1|nr:di-heme-cytochrome C peroxidase [Niveispirillum sp.]MBP7335074.1 hypothetical protein [Niveispirillum sp.]
MVRKTWIRTLPLAAFILGLTACGADTSHVEIGSVPAGKLPVPKWQASNAMGGVAELAPGQDGWAGWWGVDQGWSADQRRAFWFTPQGSWMVPYGWLLAVEQANNQERFLAPANMERLGYIPAQKDIWNPEALPIGFTVTPGAKGPDGKPGMAWAGPNCAACHTNRLDYGGKSLIIDGAPSLGDFYRLNAELLDALLVTSEQKDKFDRFVTQLVAKGFIPADTPAARNELLGQMAEHQIWLAEYLRRNLCGSHQSKECPVDAKPGVSTYDAYEAKNTALKANLRIQTLEARARQDAIIRDNYVPLPGNGRIDAIGAIFNQVSGYNIAVPEANYSPSNAPVSYPFLWGAPQSDVVQWNGFAQNTSVLGIGVGPLGRNTGEVLGVYGRIRVTPNDPSKYTVSDGSFEDVPGKDPRFGFASTVLTMNLGHIENWLSSLRSPRWPDGVLPAIDKEKAARGAQIYNGKQDEKVNCSLCHQVIARKDEGEPYKATLIQTSVIGTDPAMADNFLLRLNKETGLEWESGKLEGKRPNLVEFWAKPYGTTLPDRGEALVVQVAGVLLSDFSNTISAGRLSKTYTGSFDKGADPRSYKARPLTGIWATAPYLHNGSVPTLADLLTDEKRRPTSFHVGSRQFDPVKVGYQTEPEPGRETYEFDTGFPGNFNTGHTGRLYGTELGDDDKLALIEYLKTL